MDQSKGGDLGPLEAYQWSAVQAARGVVFTKIATIVLLVAVLATCVGFQAWNTVTSSVERNRINCEVAGWNKLWSAVVADQNAAARHQTAPKFIPPKPC